MKYLTFDFELKVKVTKFYYIFFKLPLYDDNFDKIDQAVRLLGYFC